IWPVHVSESRKFAREFPEQHARTGHAGRIGASAPSRPRRAADRRRLWRRNDQPRAARRRGGLHANAWEAIRTAHQPSDGTDVVPDCRWSEMKSEIRTPKPE